MKPQFFINRICGASLALLVGLSIALVGALWAGASPPVRADEPPIQLASLNPNFPASPVRLIFVHHSTGENWLNDDNGGLGIALRDNNYFVSDTNYSWGPDSIGDRTDIVNWPEWFTGPNRDTYTSALYNESNQNSSYSRLATNPGGGNQIIMFKSCFPNSALDGPTDPPYSIPNDWEYSVRNAKAVYNNILTYFATRQDKLFVVITAPPLASGDSTQAANARAFNNWLVNNWLTGYPYTNVAVFDFYNVLTSNGGNSNTNDLNQTAGNHHRWRNGVIEHTQTVNNNYSRYPTSDSHPSKAGNLKATAEFVPLLNIFYHRWQDSILTTRKNAQAAVPKQSDTITYTIVIQNYPAPVTATLYLTDTVPDGLAYVPGSLIATSGLYTATAPILTWSGQLTPTPVITITYAVTVTTALTQTIANTAVIAAPGYTTTRHIATVCVNCRAIYLPVVFKQ